MAAPRPRPRPGPALPTAVPRKPRLGPVQARQTPILGGAAAQPLDPEVVVAPLRDASAVEAAERRARWAIPDGYDPFPASRIGYDNDT